MWNTLLTAIATYLAASIDEVPVLFMLYTKSSNRGKSKIITLSYFIGTFVLVGLGLMGALGLSLISQKWIIGLVGLVPLVMGIKVLLKGEDDDEEEEAMAASQKYKTLAVQVLAITIGLGADDLGVYIPLFTTLTGLEILQMLLVFALCTAVLCLISYRLTKIEVLTDFIEKYERYIVGTIFAAIGIFVMAECGTLAKLLR